MKGHPMKSELQVIYIYTYIQYICTLFKMPISPKLLCMVGSEIQHVTQTRKVNKCLSFGPFSRGWCLSTGPLTCQDCIWSVEESTVLINTIKTDMELGSTVCAVRSKRVLIGDKVRPAVILIKDGKIHEILSDRDFSEDVTCEVSWLSLISVSGYSTWWN